MADRNDYYFRQKVTEAELDDGFAKMEQGQLDIMADQQLIGVFSGGEVSEHAATPDLTVDIAGPCLGRDKDGNRLFFSPLQNLDMSVDENAVSTAVGTPGNEKTLSIFLSFDRSLSDPRLDGNAVTVFFSRAEYFKLNVAQSAEAPIGTSTPPALRADEILLADVVIINAQTQILNADIDTARREDVFVLSGSPYAIRTGRVKAALQDMLDTLNTVVNGGASTIGYAGGGNWADGTTNPATDVEAQLDKIITDLGGGTGGTAKISGAASADPNPVLTATDLAAQLTELENQIINGTKHGQLSVYGHLLSAYGEGAWGINTSTGWPVWQLSGATGDYLFLPVLPRVNDNITEVRFSYNSTDVTHDLSSTLVKIDQHPAGAPITEVVIDGPTVHPGSTLTVAAAHPCNIVSDSSADLYFVKITDADVGVTARNVRNYRWLVNRQAA